MTKQISSLLIIIGVDHSESSMVAMLSRYLVYLLWWELIIVVGSSPTYCSLSGSVHSEGKEEQD